MMKTLMLTLMITSVLLTLLQANPLRRVTRREVLGTNLIFLPLSSLYIITNNITKD